MIQATPLKKLPIGIQTLSHILEGGYVYVDKTAIALRLIESGKYFFLARPRRFGKSLFLDTLKQIFKGNKTLFKDLYIAGKWDFEIQHPVIHLDLSVGVSKDLAELEQNLRLTIENAENELGLPGATDKHSLARLNDLIRSAKEKTGQHVVLLVDEYDKPILDNITNEPSAREIRDALKALYSIIKSNDDHIRFAFLTGVSKFSKLNLFSGLNNLNDITLDEKYATICGYTHQDLSAHFGSWLQSVDLGKVKEWYNGYNYLGEKVYNPFDILLFIDKGFEYRNYWWSTGNPSFLVDLLYKKDYSLPDLENYVATDAMLDSFDVDSIELEPLLWQTGYLTIKEKYIHRGLVKYRMEVPNLEIQHSLNDFFIDVLTTQKREKIHYQDKLHLALQTGDHEALKNTLIALFASIPYQNFSNNKIANYEGYYASVLYAYFASLGFETIAEDATNMGRIDLTLLVRDKAYIFEFKVVEKPSGNALQQIKTHAYHQKYRHQKQCYLIGIEFGKQVRNIVHFEVESIA